MTSYCYLARSLQHISLTIHLRFLVTDKSKGITDGELKKLKAHIDNGDQMLDNSALEDFRKKIINELGQKDDAKGGKTLANDSRKSSDFHRNKQSSRFVEPHRQPRDNFRRNNSNDQNRRNNVSRGGHRMSFHEQNRNLNRSRER